MRNFELLITANVKEGDCLFSMLKTFSFPVVRKERDRKISFSIEIGSDSFSSAFDIARRKCVYAGFSDIKVRGIFDLPTIENLTKV